MSKTTRRPRLLFLDNIKVLFTILVIFQHARVTYAGSGWWYYVESNPIDTLSLIFFISLTAIGGLFQSSLMGLFFLMGGYFTPISYDRKGGPSFWKERLLRLGIPLLLYILLINPIMYYVLSNYGIEPWSSDPTLQGLLLDYYISQFESLDSFLNFLTDAGPMWFLYVLLLFTAGYTLWRQITKIDSIERLIPKELPIPRYIYLLLIAIGLGCVTFLVRLVFPIDKFPLGIPAGFIIQYTMMFSIGVIAVRYDWFEKMTKDSIKIWSITIAAAVVMLSLYWFIFLGVDTDLSVALGGATIAAFLFALVDNIICMGMIFILIPIFYAKFNHQGTLLKNLSSSAFHMYLIHPPILVLVSLAFASVPLFPVIKLAIVWPLTVILCYLVSHYFLQKIRLNKIPVPE
ncbi:MAG: acyltransferase family protein [Anaerolineales bacterium]